MSTIWTRLPGILTGTNERLKLEATSDASDSEFTPLQSSAEPISQLRPLCLVAQPSGVCLKPKPVTPETVMQWRYEQSFYKRNTEHGLPESNILNPTTRFCDENKLSADSKWKHCISPEGKSYFMNTEKNTFTYTNIFTHTNMYVPENRQKIERVLRDYFVDGTGPTERPHGVELVLEIPQSELEDGKPDFICGYYYADWEKRVVLWHDGMDIAKITKGQRPLASMSHLGYAVEAQFWYHVEMFPNHRFPSAKLIREVKGHLNYAYSDLVTSETSTAPYDLETIKEFVEIVHKIPANDESSTDIGNEGYEEGAGRDMIAIARVMHTITDGMFLNYHGQYCARLNRDQSVQPGSTKEKRLSAFFCLVSPILFYMPDSYMKKLDMVWVDDTLNHYRWKEFITRMRAEWERYNTPATVMLTTNVAFLAIQSIDTDHANNARNVAQIASYASTLLSLACYAIYHVLILRFPHAHNRSLVKVSTYLKRRELGWLGLESLALVFSLPTSLFMWSMIAFLVAMSYAVFVGTDVYTKTMVGILLGVLLAVTFSVIGITWQGGGRIPARENQWVESFSSLKTQLVKRPPTEKNSGAPMTCRRRSSPVSGPILPL